MTDAQHYTTVLECTDVTLPVALLYMARGNEIKDACTYIHQEVKFLTDGESTYSSKRVLSGCIIMMRTWTLCHYVGIPNFPRFGV